MRRPSSRGVLVLMAAALVALTLLLAQGDDGGPTLSARSNAPTGGRALALWLGELGYRVEEIDTSPYAVPDDTGVVFVLQPTMAFEQSAVDTLAAWVEEGGRLVIGAAAPLSPMESLPRLLLQRFGFSVRRIEAQQPDALAVQPVLLRPPVDRVRVEAWQELRGSDDWVPWLGADGHVFAGARTVGRGQVVVLAAAHPLTNAGLAEADNAALALHLLGSAPPGTRVAFDEYHHGFVREAARGLWPLLTSTFWGWAALYATAVAYLYLLLGGRRFGRALVPVARPRRSLTEYVSSLASLYRRAGQRAYAADRLANAFKREVAAALGLPLALGDEAFASAAAQRRGVSAAPLRALLARLRDGHGLSEDELLRLAREADALAARLLRQGSRRPSS